jgi:hypothetical protein
LFDSKTGTCSDFATAMTLMVREIGIPARYVEGYIVKEQNEDGDYIIKVKHGHAFPEVFIENEGWIIFEPTIPGSDNDNKINYKTVLITLASIGGTGILTILFLIFVLPQIKENNFRRRVRSSTAEIKVQLVYNKIYDEFMKDLRLKGRTISSQDLVNLAESKYGLNLQNLTENYDRVVYGGIDALDNDYFAIYLDFVTHYNN